MTLEEDVLEPLKWADGKLKSQFDKLRLKILGEKISDNYGAILAYGIGAGIVGSNILIGNGFNQLIPSYPILGLLAHIAADTFYAGAFFHGLDLKRQGRGAAEKTAYANLLFRFARAYSRAMRFPMMLTAGAAAIKGGYDIAMLVSGGEPLFGVDTLPVLKLGVGLFADASLMYLRDNDASQPQGKKMRKIPQIV